jgi:hypothetical protein
MAELATRTTAAEREAEVAVAEVRGVRSRPRRLDNSVVQ